MSEDDSSRMSVNIPTGLNNDLRRCVPWGSKNTVVLALLTKFVETLQQNGSYVYLDVIQGNFEIVCSGAARGPGDNPA